MLLPLVGIACDEYGLDEQAGVNQALSAYIPGLVEGTVYLHSFLVLKSREPKPYRRRTRSAYTERNVLAVPRERAALFEIEERTSRWPGEWKKLELA